MSSSVNVDTNAGAAGYGILAGGAVAVAGALYFAGFSFSNISNIILALTTILVALLIWLVLTDVKKLADLLQNNQLVATVASCIIGAGVLVSVMQNIGSKSLIPSSR
jgi:hypothetical protein